jgi:hypothetical protein
MAGGRGGRALSMTNKQQKISQTQKAVVEENKILIISTSSVHIYRPSTFYT